MKPPHLTWCFAFLLLTIGIAVAGLASQAQPPVATTQDTQRILIHMKEYTAEIHATYMALELADRLQHSGANVTLFLELRAVRLADDQIAGAIRPVPGFRPFSEIYKSLVDNGGQVLVCHHCAEVAEISPNHLRKGARMADVEDLSRAILSAHKILDY